MRRIALIITVLFCLLIVAPASFAAGKDKWISVRSKNFFLVGNAGEKEMRVVAVRLEQFREAFALLLPKVKFSSPVPTTVIVFKSDGAYTALQARGQQQDLKGGRGLLPARR